MYMLGKEQELGVSIFLDNLFWNYSLGMAFVLIFEAMHGDSSSSGLHSISIRC